MHLPTALLSRSLSGSTKAPDMPLAAGSCAGENNMRAGSPDARLRVDHEPALAEPAAV